MTQHKAFATFALLAVHWPCRASLQLAGIAHAPPPLLILDVGCGSGHSGAVCDERGFAWLGTDISSDMLHLVPRGATQPPTQQPGAGTPGPRPACLDVLLSDMGHGVPLRHLDSGGLFDAAISISAVSWLLFHRRGWRAASASFFRSLYRCVRVGVVCIVYCIGG
jgi:18S rRNA (guanine1575-N7)-methyltransferase